jgi:hypothetical protein
MPFNLDRLGIALRSSRSKETIVLEFQPKNFTSCFLPTVKKHRESNITDLVWDKRSQIAYYKIIDMGYWQQSTYLADINGVVYSHYHEWIKDYLQQDRYYCFPLSLSLLFGNKITILWTFLSRLYAPQSICEDGELNFCYYYSQTWDSFLAHRFFILSNISF